MKIPAQPYRCPLGRIQPVTANLEAVKERGWRDQHILVVNEEGVAGVCRSVDDAIRLLEAA